MVAIAAKYRHMETGESSGVDTDQYGGEWVAIDPAWDTVIAHGQSIAKVVQEARKQGITEPVVYPVPKSGGYFE